MVILFENYCVKSLTTVRGEILTKANNSISPGFFELALISSYDFYLIYPLFDVLAVLQFSPSLLSDPVAEKK